MSHKSLLMTAGGLLAFALNASAVDLQTHTPQFHWKAGSQGQKWLYDGEMPVAKFFAGYSRGKTPEGDRPADFVARASVDSGRSPVRCRRGELRAHFVCPGGST